MSDIKRRALLQSASAALVAGLPRSAPVQTHSQPHTGREHYRGNLGRACEFWRGKAASDNVAWRKVDMPHCFNARDSVDPDEPYYEGPGWYRTNLRVDNPYQNGRTLPHFEGAGQKNTVEMYNGRAIIRVNRKGGESMIAVASKDLPPPFVRIA